MTGFIKGLFGGKKQAQTDAPRSKEAYFLDPDSAKTFGDIDFMRKSKTIEHTFPRGSAQVSQVSSSNYQKVSDKGLPVSLPTSNPAPQSSTTSQATSFQPSSFTPPTPSFNKGKSTVKRSNDSNLDMFRKMAKDIKKR